MNKTHRMWPSHLAVPKIHETSPLMVGSIVCATLRRTYVHQLVIDRLTRVVAAPSFSSRNFIHTSIKCHEDRGGQPTKGGKAPYSQYRQGFIQRGGGAGKGDYNFRMTVFLFLNESRQLYCC